MEYKSVACPLCLLFKESRRDQPFTRTREHV